MQLYIHETANVLLGPWWEWVSWNCTTPELYKTLHISQEISEIIFKLLTILLQLKIIWWGVLCRLRWFGGEAPCDENVSVVLKWKLHDYSFNKEILAEKNYKWLKSWILIRRNVDVHSTLLHVFQLSTSNFVNIFVCIFIVHAQPYKSQQTLLLWWSQYSLAFANKNFASDFCKWVSSWNTSDILLSWKIVLILQIALDCLHQMIH